MRNDRWQRRKCHVGRKKDVRPYRPKEADFLHWSCVSAGLLYDGGKSPIFLTKEKKDEVKEVNAVVTEEPKVNTGYAAMETNPLLENRDEELADAVEAYYQELSGKESYAEAYDGIAIYTKDGKAKGSRILYVRYNMKIRGIYTEVPGLETLYAVKDKDGKFDIQAEISDEQIQTIIEEVSAQTDVQELFAQVEADYEQALGFRCNARTGGGRSEKMQWISNTVNTASQ